MRHPPTGDPFEAPSPGSDPGYAPASDGQLMPPPIGTYDPYAQHLQPYQPAQYAQPTSGYPPGAGHPGGHPGYPPPFGYGPQTNGMAIAALVVSIVGLLGLCGYFLGGYIGIIGVVLGLLARRQIKERGEGGDGLALAGVIVGSIAAAISVTATVVAVIALITLA